MEIFKSLWETGLWVFLAIGLFPIVAIGIIKWLKGPKG